MTVMAVDGTTGLEEIYQLLVLEVRYEAAGVVSLVLGEPDGGPLHSWDPGAHLDLILPSGLVRQYSLCGDLDDDRRYRVAVLLEPESRGGSKEIHETGLVGRMLSVRGPRNHFHLEPAPEYLFMAGGIGITPIIPMLQQAERTSVPWRLVYGGRNRKTMAFLDVIGRRGGGAVDIVPEDELGFPDFATILEKAPSGTSMYACGPPGMLAALEGKCGQLQKTEALHVERFTAPEVTAAPLDPDTAEAFEVELARSGQLLSVPPDRTVLEVIRQVTPSVLYACEEGYCGTCEVRVLEGIPDHRDVYLSDEEHDSTKTMMVCVSRSRSPRLVLDL
jgi:ferredoxin-NADP reductase